MKHIMKKIVSIVLCYLFVVSLLPFSTIVAAAATYGGSGTEADPYIVSSQAQLVSTLSTNNTAGTYIKLTKDITLSSSYVPGVLYANLDGDFHKITSQTQFFTQNRGTLKNFYYTDTVTRTNTSGSYAGIVCDENYGSISGVIATGNINNRCYHTSSGDNEVICAARAGIIAGTSSGTVVNCAAFGSVSLYCSYGSHAAGISAYGSVTNCYASVSVSATGSSRYGSSTQAPLTLGTVTNSYFNSDKYSEATGGYLATDMKTDAFVELLNSNPVLTDSKWVRDTQNKNSGYPILQPALNVTITPSKTNVVLNGTESVALTCSDAAATLYYTLDGSEPTTTSARYTAPISICNTTTLTVVAYKNGVQSAPKRFIFAEVRGSGTTQDPYQVDSETALYAISELGGDDCYILTKNIALKWSLPSLGNFSGHFDGQGYEISNVYTEKQIAGLTDTNYGIIENVTLRVKDNGELVAGAGFAKSNYGAIYNCHFKGNLNSKDMSDSNTGGIVGENCGRIESTTFEGKFSSDCTNKGGGLVGLNSGTVAYCDFNGDVDIKNISFRCYPDFQGYVGGLVGYNSGSIQYSNVTASSVYAYSSNYTGVLVGALIGGGTTSTVVDCTENVTTVTYDYTYIEWGSVGSNRDTGKSSGNPIPTPHDHEFYFDIDQPVCGEQRNMVCVCDCGISIVVRSWSDDYYNADHQYVDTVIDPTCTEEGTCTKVCETCSHTVVESIPATGHKTSIPYFKITNDSTYPFNISNGTMSSTNNTSYSTSVLTLEVLRDHSLSFDYYLSSYYSSCKLYVYLNGTQITYTNSDTKYSRTINVKCGDVITVKFVKDTSTSTVYTGYFAITSPMEEKVPFACDKPAICEWCNAEITPEFVVHTWDEGVFTTEWSCTSNGVKLYTCTNCGETKTEEYAATGHHVTVDTSKAPELRNDKTYPFSLSGTKYTSTNKANNSTSKFTIVAWYNCTIALNYGVSSESSFDYFTIYKNGGQIDRISGSYSGRTKILTLVAGDVVEIVYSKDGSSSSGSDSGYFTITSCTVSGIDASGRIPAENVHANCAGGVVCEDCGAEIKPALEHTWNDGVITTQPTHLTEGVKTFTCECGATKTEAIEKLADHEWDNGEITTVPTHTTEGVKTYTCVCGETYTEVVEKLADHEWDNGVITTTPTCTTEGVETFTCECGDTYTETVSALGHAYTAQGDCSVCGEYRATFSGASLTLEDNIAVNFKVAPEQFEGTGYTNPYVVFTFNGEQYTVTEYTFDTKGRYAFAFTDIAPRMMNDVIVATLYATYDGEQVVCQSRNYSVKEYCYNMLARCNEGGAYANNEKFKALLVDLLNYGEAAQIYGNYNVGTLVTADLTETQKNWATDVKPNVSTVQNLTYKTIKNPAVSWKAGGLLLEDAVTMRFKFSVDSIEDVTVKFYTNNNPTGWVVSADELVETSGGYYVYFDGLKARQMRETVYITVYRGDTAISNTVSYSIESYAYAKRNDSNTNLTALLEAMMKYGDSADRYING